MEIWIQGSLAVGPRNNFLMLCGAGLVKVISGQEEWHLDFNCLLLLAACLTFSCCWIYGRDKMSGKNIVCGGGCILQLGESADISIRIRMCCDQVLALHTRNLTSETMYWCCISIMNTIHCSRWATYFYMLYLSTCVTCKSDTERLWNTWKSLNTFYLCWSMAFADSILK